MVYNALPQKLHISCLFSFLAK